MAIHLPWFPSKFSTDTNHQSLSLHTPSQPSFSCPIPPISHFTSISYTRKKPNLLIVQVSSATEQQSPPSISPEPRTRLIAQNIPWSSTADDIRTLFEKHGNVMDVELSMYNKGRNRGLAFITMGSEEEAIEAISKLESSEYEGRSISVAYAKSLKNRRPVDEVAVPRCDVFVANLSWKVKAKDLKEFFGSMNEHIASAQITYQMKPTRKPTGFGFVSFGSKEKAEEAISAFQGKELMGKPVRLALSTRYLKAEAKDGNVVEPSNEINAEAGISENADAITT
ncbi:hypothetical protein ACHQM5_023733 [Ranunculus cassubicifolius]